MNDAKLSRLKRLEGMLQHAVKTADLKKAMLIAADIRDLLAPNAKHHRFLRAKLWCCEAALMANDTETAMQGAEGVQAQCKSGSKLHLEAKAILALCQLRKKQTELAQQTIREVIRQFNTIKSEASRRLFQARFLERIEQETLLSELIGTGPGELKSEEVFQDAESMVKTKTEGEILAIIGTKIPKTSVLRIEKFRAFTLLQFTAADRAAHEQSAAEETRPAVEKGVASFFKRVAWRTFCRPDSEIFKLWSEGLPKIADRRVMTTAAITALGEFRISVPILAAGLAAALIKSTAEAFCERADPEIFMTTRKEVSMSRRNGAAQ